jgi:Flp pilus assembly protein TadD
MRILVALALLAFPSNGAWNCATEGKRQVCADGSARRALAVLDQLRTLESAWDAKHGRLPDATPPLRVMLYRSRAEFSPFQLTAANLGLFQSGADRDWLMVLDSGESGMRAARHEWVHRAHHHSTPVLPLWLEEGLAEYWSTIEAAGGQARLGKMVPDHIRLLNQSRWLTAAELFGATKQSDWYRDERLSGVFYAQSWALVHLLGQHPDWKGKLDPFIAAIASGGSPAGAFHQFWGRTPDQAVEEARLRVRQGAPGWETIDLPPPGDGGAPQSAPLSEPEATLMKAEALLACNRTGEAQLLIGEAARRQWMGPELISARAFVALQRGDKAAALRLFEEAIARGDNRGAVMLERAMLMRETGAPRAQVKAALAAAVQVSPGLAEAWHLLANMAAADSDVEGAVEASEKAVAILPRQSIFWESLGRAYLAAGRPIDAATAAGKALLSAQTENERQMAEGLKKTVAALRPPETPKPPKPWLQIPEGWQGPKPDAALSGRLVDVSCGADSLLFTVETAPRQRTVLRAADPSKVFLRQQEGEKREFICGAQKPVLLVEAGYRAGADAKTKSAGELIVLKIHGAENPPPPPPAAKKKPQPVTKPPAKKAPAPAKKQ